MKPISGLTTKVKASRLVKVFSDQKNQPSVLPVLWQWRLEFAIVLMSCVLLGAIFGVLHHNRDQEVASWSLSGMSLDTLIALLSALLRAHILTIAEEVSLIKPAEGYGVQSYFQLGSMPGCESLPPASLAKLIRSSSSYIYVGCLIMVLSLGIGPFTQQASSTQPCVKNVTGASATIPYSWGGFNRFRTGNHAGSYWRVDTEYTEVIARASINISSASSASLLQGCTTGNCSFPAVRGDISLSTLGICSRCLDTTSYVISRGDRAMLLSEEARSLFVGFTSNTTQSTSSEDLEWARADFDDDLRDVFGASIANYTFLGLTSDGCQYENRTAEVKYCARPPAIGEHSILGFNVYSSACTFYFCMRHHKVDDSRAGTFHVWKPVCEVGSKTLDLTSARTKSFNNDSVQVELRGRGTETVDIPWSGRRVIKASLEMIEGYCLYPPDVPESPPSLSLRVDLLKCRPWNLYSLFNGALASFSTISETMSRIASAISDHMRVREAKRDFRVSSQSPDRHGGYIRGDVHYTTICTKFQWRWLLGPALLLLMTIGFFAHAVTRCVVRRGREPLWKSSIFPALYFNAESQGQGSERELSELEKRAKSMFATLSVTDEGKWELVHGTDEVSGSGRSDPSNEEVALMDIPPPITQEGDDTSR
ncbi:unnamed protein product [Clonostachys chloroleuca]|uniref:Uncharacterized protein n=1 Tax=Clonostachys chloroleuca TaxID=1926264 RepID=A0AA35M6Z8_9HYPO|nr:unnamed protein product [Clonostachys chloroleuca]